MNHIYRLKHSGRLQQLQPVPETARSAGKGQARTAKALAQTVAGALAAVVVGGVASLVHAQQAPPSATQLPVAGVVSRGAASIQSSTSASSATMTIHQTSSRAVIDWASFNVGANAKVQFNQPGTNAVTLNNILGDNASQIYGQISANGQVFLSNPNGVYFSPTAQVNVGGLVATTGKANADEFMAGKAAFSRQGSTGNVVNEGQLQAAVGGYIALLAPEVRNQGVVVAQAGTVALASGEAIELNFNNAGTGLTGITTTAQTITALVDNRSAVLAEGGQIILSAHALAALQGAVVKNSGKLSATSLSDKGGKIVLMGDQIELPGASRIEASGATGGGTVLVGGDWQGSGDTRQATQVSMASGASIEANATQSGDGGKVVLWSDVSKPHSLTQVQGRIEAKGAGTGQGGQVETSGHTLKVGNAAQVDTGGGLWLLDPYDFTIAASGGDITGAALGTALASGNVSITTSASSAPAVTGATAGLGSAGSGDIVINDTLSWSANTLTLSAHHSVLVNNVVSVSGTGGLTVSTNTGGTTYSLNTGNNTVGDREGYLKMKQNMVDSGGSTSGTDTFDGKINWTSSGAPSINGDTYTIISTAADLVSRIGTSNNVSGKFALAADITLTGAWTPRSGFSGKLEGLGHTISGLQISGTSPNIALIREITGGANTTFLQNIGLVGANITNSASYTGGFVGFINLGNSSYRVYLRNLFVDSTSHISGSGGSNTYGFGGWVGAMNSFFSSSAATPVVLMVDGYNAAKVDGSADGLGAVGGILGYNFGGNIYMLDVFNKGQIVAGIPTSINRAALGSLVGGLVGTSSYIYGLSAENLRNYADVYGGSFTGGIVGQVIGQTYATASALTSPIRLSSNYGNVYGIDRVGGIMGYGRSYPTFNNQTAEIVLEYVKNTGAINATADSAGGIVGYVNAWGSGAALAIKEAVNTGAVSGTYDVGGLLGAFFSSNAPALGSHPEASVKIDNARNTGAVSAAPASTQYANTGVGGIFGHVDSAYLDMSSAYNTGQVSKAVTPTINSNQVDTTVGGIGGAFIPQNPNTGTYDNGKFVNVYSANDKATGASIFGASCAGANCVAQYNVTSWNGIDNSKTAANIAAASLATLGFSTSYWGGGSGVLPFLLVPEKAQLNYTLSTVASGVTYSGSAVSLSSLWSASSIFGAGFSSWVAGTDYSFSYGGNTVTGLTNAGTYAGITVNLLNSSYALHPTGNTTGSLTIAARPINVTVSPASKVYGEALPTLGYTLEVNSTGRGLVGSDTFSGALATTATSTSSVGTYAVTAGTLANSNYAITLVGGSNALSVTARPINVTVTPASKVYGEAAPTLGYTLEANGAGRGLVGSDTFSGALAFAVNSSAGSYDVTAGTLANSNYAITLVGGSNALSVTPRPISVTVMPASKVYGEANPTLGYTLEANSAGRGLVGSDTFSGALAATATSTSSVGTYDVTAGTLANSHYAITLVGSSNALSVTARPIKVTVTPVSKVYGEANPTLGYTLEANSAGRGLVGSDAFSGVLATNATRTSSVGNYDVTAGTLTNSNYAITLQNGANALSVTPRPINVTVTPVSKEYGEPTPALDYTLEANSAGRGLVGSDAFSGALASAVTSTSHAGSYDVTVGTLSNSNYALTLLNARNALTVKPPKMDNSAGALEKTLLRGRDMGADFKPTTMAGVLTVSQIDAQEVIPIKGVVERKRPQ